MSKYLLGDQWFRTKDEVEKRIHDMLYAYPLGTRTSIEDTAMLLDLLQGHPRAQAKIGCGIAAFEVRRSPMFPGLPNQRCFYLIRTDGSEDDFSYNKCIRYPTRRQVFRSICRRLVAFDVARFKDNHFQQHAGPDERVQCPITGEWVTYEDAHVDHIPPMTFERLVRDFIEREDIDENTVALREIDRVMGQIFADDHLRQSWVTYHKLNAQLRVVSAYANLHIIPRLAREQKSASQQASDTSTRKEIA